MNLRNVLKVYSLQRQFSDDESALLATLRAMTDTERELLVESLQPEQKASKAATTRTVEKCGVDGCDYTKRAAVHKDSNIEGYHEFQPPQPAAKRTRQTQTSICTDCDYGKGHAIHSDSKLAGYHEFKFARNSSGKSARATGLAATLNKNLAQQRKPMCATCGSTDPNDGDHGTGERQHEFDANVDKRLQKLMSDGPKCTFEIDGKVCKGLADSAIHDPTMGYAGYHEFVAPEARAATGGD